jgi:hypothetical protein
LDRKQDPLNLIEGISNFLRAKVLYSLIELFGIQKIVKNDENFYEPVQAYKNYLNDPLNLSYFDKCCLFIDDNTRWF